MRSSFGAFTLAIWIGLLTPALATNPPWQWHLLRVPLGIARWEPSVADHAADNPHLLPKPDAPEEIWVKRIQEDTSILLHSQPLEGVELQKDIAFLLDPVSGSLAVRCTSSDAKVLLELCDDLRRDTSPVVELDLSAQKSNLDARSLAEPLAESSPRSLHPHSLQETHLVSSIKAVAISTQEFTETSSALTLLPSMEVLGYPMALPDGDHAALSVLADFHLPKTSAQLSPYSIRFTSSIEIREDLTSRIGLWQPENPFVSQGTGANTTPLYAIVVKGKVNHALPEENHRLLEKLTAMAEKAIPSQDHETVRSNKGLIPMRSRRFLVPRVSWLELQPPGGSKWTTARSSLQASGISFPAGARAYYDLATSILTVHNTVSNLDQIEAYFTQELRPCQRLISVTAQVYHAKAPVWREISALSLTSSLPIRQQLAQQVAQARADVVTTLGIETRGGPAQMIVNQGNLRQCSLAVEADQQWSFPPGRHGWLVNATWSREKAFESHSGAFAMEQKGEYLLGPWPVRLSNEFHSEDLWEGVLIQAANIDLPDNDRE